MSKNLKTFIRTVYLSSTIIFCLIIGFYGISKAYENIRLIGFGEYRKAIEFKEDEILIFDYKIEKF